MQKLLLVILISILCLGTRNFAVFLRAWLKNKCLGATFLVFVAILEVLFAMLGSYEVFRRTQAPALAQLLAALFFLLVAVLQAMPWRSNHHG